MHESSDIKVWDPLVRLFHWGLVAAFFAAYFSAESWEWLHVNAGYVVLGLVVFRILWGVVGTRHARFTDFVRGPRVIKTYVSSLLRLQAPRYLGHNPAGGAMIVLLIVMLLLTTLAGLALYGMEEHAGPLAAAVAGLGHGWEEFFEGIHEFAANATLALAGVHVLGVIAESVLHRENLVRSMWTGYKRSTHTD